MALLSQETPQPQPQTAAPAAQTAYQQQPQQQEAAHLLDYWQILFSRKEIVIAVALLMILTGIVVTRAMPKVYAAQTLIQVQREKPDINPYYGGQSGGYDPYFLKTQFEIIRSTPIIEDVVRELSLNEELGNAYGYYERMNAAASFDRTVKLVKSKMSLNIYRDTDLIAITVKFDKPDQRPGQAADLAAQTANQIAKAYKAWFLRTHHERKKGGLDVIQAELEDQRRKIDAAEVKITELRQKYNLTVLSDNDSGLASLRTEINSLSQRETQASLNAEQLRVRYEQVAQLADLDAAYSLKLLTGDPTLEPLLSERQQLEVRLSTLVQASVGKNHPDYKRTEASLSSINTKIVERVQAVKRAMRLDWNRAENELAVLRKKLDDCRAREIEFSATGATEYRAAMAELRAMKERRDFLEERAIQERTLLKIPSTNVQIIEQAKVVGTPIPVSPNFALNILLSVVAGIFFGVVLAFFVEYLDTSVKTVDDVEKYLGCATLGLVPQKVRHLNDPSARSVHSEPYRVLRTNIKSSKRMPPDGKTICVTSASAGEGKSQTIFNLAYICAESGDRTILVDTDLHRPRQHKVLQTDNTPGICNVIVGECVLDEAIRHTVHANLDFLPAGHIAGASVHGLVDTEEMMNILAELRKRYDRVFLDCPPMIGVSDSSQLVRIVDGTILVVQHRKYPRSLARRARDMIINMGGNLLGVVLNNINVARDYSSYYYKHQYYYYYPYSYTSESGTSSPKRRHSSSKK